MTETNSIGPQNSGDDYLAKPTSVGRAPAHMDMSVIDEAGAEVPAGEFGEIWFKVPSQVFVHAEQLPRNAAGKIVKNEIRDSLDSSGTWDVGPNVSGT